MFIVELLYSKENSMPYIKLLTALTALVLLTACGGVTVNNPTFVNNGNNGNNGNNATPACIANPFATDCTNATPAQEAVFCRDDSKTTDTKANDCALVAIRECDANVFDTLCPTPATEQEQDNFCRDTTKTPIGKIGNCAQIIVTACTISIYDTICTGVEVYEDRRTAANNQCLARGNSPDACNEVVRIATCDADPFPTNCTEGKYVTERRTACLTNKNSNRCMATEELICGVSGNIFEDFCTGLTATDDSRKTECESGDRTRKDCTATITRICGADGNIFDDFCTGLTATDNSRKTACESGDRNRGECTDTATRICGANGNIFDDFCTGLTATNDSRQMACESGVRTRTECEPTVTRICGANGDPLDEFCADIVAYYPAQKLACESSNKNRGECADTVTRICGVNRDSVDEFCMGLPDPDTTDTTDDMDDTDTTDDMDDTDDMDTTDDDPQKTACESGVRTRSECRETVTRICGPTGDPLDPFCADIAAYYPAQKSACKTGNPRRMECIPTVTRICGPDGDIFDNICTGLPDTNDDRQMACESGSIERRERADCTATIMRICGTAGNIFNDFCTGLTDTDDTRQMKCESGDKARMECEPTVMRICGTGGNVFDEFCTGLTNTASVRIANCIMAGNAGEEKCDTIVPVAPTNTAITACLANPFTDACKANAAFRIHADMARTNRVSFCETGGNGDNALCMDANLMGLCRFAPFNPLCPDDVYLRDRQTQCQKNDQVHPSCPTLLSLEGAVDVTDITGIVDITVPLHIMDETTKISLKDHDDLPATTADADSGAVQFIMITEDGLINGGGGALVRAGDSNDRVAWRRIGVQNFGGIAPTTNLGAPLLTGVGQPTNVWWAGRIYNYYNIVYNGRGFRNINFIINFEARTIREEPQHRGNIYTQFRMAFTPTGVITGIVRDNNLGRNVRNAELGKVRGLIGEEGMVGVFLGASLGGFVVDNPNFVADLAPSVASAADWARSFILPLPATIAASGATATVVGRFLNLDDGETTIDAGDLKTEAGGGTASASVPLTRAGDTMDGFVYINGFNGNNNQAFVGLLPTTDLGVFLSEQPTIAEWTGSYYDSTLKTAKNAITFNIDFSKRSIGVKTGSIIAASPPDFDLVFSYAGVISGTVSKGGKNAIARGLIGADGLVGAFIDTKATTGLVFHGGFVAAPPVPEPCVRAGNCMANHATWLTSFGASQPPATVDTSSVDNAAVFGGFLNLAPGTTTIAPGYLDTRTALGRPLFGDAMNPASASLPRDGDNMDGFVYISGFGFSLGSGNNQAFVGLLPTTDLGAPLTEQPSVSIAAWTGSYYDSIAAASAAATFNIDFSNRSISTSGISAASPPAFNLAFNDAGVITGTVTKNSIAAIARGLIGKEGLVGAFVDTSATAGSVFHGGFVATAPLCIAADTCILGRFLNLESGATTIAPGDLKTTASGGTASVSVPLTRADDTADGFVYISGFKGNNNQALVGLLPSTDLGALLTDQPPIAEWTGSYYDSTLKTATNAIIFNIDFSTLSIDVKANSIIAASPPAFNLGFNDAGVITGTVTKNSIEATVRGLIGADGLVGAFIDTNPAAGSIVFHGGFVAAPSVPDPCILAVNCIANHAAWLKNFGTSQPPATINASGTEAKVFGGFLNLATGTTTIAPGDLKTMASGSTASPSVILPRDGDTMDGVVYISGFNGDNNQAFVGLLPTTNLGVALTKQPHIAKWAGSYYDSTDSATAANDIIFNIDFSMRSIDVKAGSITANDPPAFNLDFNDAGVITGTVSKGGTAAIARGLIGAEGLVGAFIDTSAAAGSVFHGGFVATAPPCLAADTCVRHFTWLKSVSPLPTTIATTATEAKVFGGFLNLADGATTIDANTFDSTGFATVLTVDYASQIGLGVELEEPPSVILRRDGDATDGVVYIGGYNLVNHQAFAGLLSTTNLGDPFPIRTGGDTTAMWTGKYYSSGDSNTVSSSVTFTIDFGTAQSINGTGAGAGAPVFALDFNDAGVISGNVTAGGNEATASGLIGREGLVGVFVDTTHPAQTPRIPILYGGFVADNPNP